MQDKEDEVIHVPEFDDDAPGLGEQETLPGGGISVGDAVPEMPPGGGLDATDLAEPTSTADTTGDRATGLTGLRGG